MTANASGRSLAERLRLVVITDTELAAPRSVVEIVEEALQAGAPAVQLRAKGGTARSTLELAHELGPRVQAAGALFFVNDRLDVALAARADGVHLGPDDLPVAAARQAVPGEFLIGASADDPDEARRLIEDGADYIGCGAVFPTSTKLDAGEVIGVEGLAAVVRAVDRPVIGIGGVDAWRAAEIAASGAAGSAVAGAVMTAPDVRATVAELLAPWS